MMYGEMMLGLPSTPGAPLVRLVGREGGGAWMEPAPEQREVEGRGGAFFLVRGAPLASYGLVAHFPSCSPVVVVDDVAHVFEQRLTRLAYVLVRVCLRVSFRLPGFTHYTTRVLHTMGYTIPRCLII
jgi:hypothetical protein